MNQSMICLLKKKNNDNTEEIVANMEILVVTCSSVFTLDANSGQINAVLRIEI